MTTITIPKTVQNEDLVAVPRATYKEFLKWQEKVKGAEVFIPTAREKRALAKARKPGRSKKSLTIAQAYNALGIKN